MAENCPLRRHGWSVTAILAALPALLALGVILYALIALRTPRRATSKETLEKVWRRVTSEVPSESSFAELQREQLLGVLLQPVVLILAAGVSTDLYDIVRVVTTVCCACFGVPLTPIVAHQIDTARHAPVQANPRHRNGPAEH